MRPITKLVTLGVLAAAVAAPGASAATVTANAEVAGKGTDLYAAPSKVVVNGAFTTPTTTDGNQQLKSIQANLPEQILFNQLKFTQCDIASFTSTGTCSSKSKLGEATIIADGGAAVGDITAKATMYLGKGFTVLTRVVVEEKAPIDEKVVGTLRSSGEAGYGMQLFIPATQLIRQPLGAGSTLFPTIKSIDATIQTPVRKTKVRNNKGKNTSISIPLAGLEKCGGKLPFSLAASYSNAAAGTTEAYDPTNGRPIAATQVESAFGNAKCKSVKKLSK